MQETDNPQTEKVLAEIYSTASKSLVDFFRTFFKGD